jgi:aarF domain-containing kinase
VSINDFLGIHNPLNKKIALIGIESYMKMMLADHFVHADLHPGNILVRLVKPDQPKLIFLDVGLVAELSPEDSHKFIELFKAVVKGDGERGSELMIEHAREPPRFKNEEERGDDISSNFLRNGKFC